MHLREKQIFKKIVLSCPFDLFNAEQAAFNDFVAHSNLEFGYIAGLQLIISMYLLFFSFKIASYFLLSDPGKPVNEVFGFGDLVYTFSNLPSTQGLLRVVLYNDDKQFLSENGWARADSAYIRPDSTAEVRLKQVAFGEYAAALYLDENQNGVIDRNVIGLPTEAYGFSNNVRAKWSVPSFRKVLFTFNQAAETVPSRVAYWSKQ